MRMGGFLEAAVATVSERPALSRPQALSIVPGTLRKAAFMRVPRVDGRDDEGQVGDLLLGELAADALVDVVRHALRRDLRERFRPGQAGALAWREQVRFTPDGDVVQAQRTLAMDDRLPDHACRRRTRNH